MANPNIETDLLKIMFNNLTSDLMKNNKIIIKAAKILTEWMIWVLKRWYKIISFDV